MHIAIEGLDGVGKTSTAKSLAEKLGAEYFSKALHEMNDISGKYENFTTLEEFSGGAVSGSRLGMRGAFLYAKYSGVDIVTERYLATNYWANDIAGRFDELSTVIRWIGKPDLTVILYSQLSTIYKRMYDRNPCDKDFPKLESHETAYEKMVKFAKSAELPSILFDTTRLTLEQVSSTLFKYICGEITAGKYEDFEIQAIYVPITACKKTEKTQEGELVVLDNVTHILKSDIPRDISIQFVQIPASVKFIANDAWDDLEHLEAIYVAKDNTEYCDMDGVLYNKNISELIRYPRNHANTSFVVPDSVTRLANDSFFMSVVKSVTLHDEVHKIGYFTFFGCKNLEYLKIGNGLRYLGRNSMTRCKNLRKVISNGYYKANASVLTDSNAAVKRVFISSGSFIIERSKVISAWAFEGTAIKKVVVKANIKILEAYSFVESYIQTIVLEDTRKIGDMAFWNCCNLRELVFLSTASPKIGKDIFRNLDNKIIIRVPSDALDDYKQAFIKNTAQVEIVGITSDWRGEK